MATFEFLRVSLLVPDQSELFSSSGQPFRGLSRREYLDQIFSPDVIDFTYRGRNFSFLKHGMWGDILVGRIGKPLIESVHEGPETGYAAKIQENWKPVWMLFDLASDSQLIILDAGISNTKGIVGALLSHAAQKTEPKYYNIFVEYVSEIQDFWRAVDEYKGRITRLEFSFVPPNALGLKEKIRTLVDTGRNIGAQTTKFVHTNKDGKLHPEGEYVDAALATAGEGAGSVQMKSGRKVIFSSNKNRKTISISNDEIPTSADQASIEDLIKKTVG